MTVKEKLKIIDDKLKEMYIDGSKETALSMKASNRRFDNAYAELLYLHEELDRIANVPTEKDLDIFDNLASQFVELWGKVLRTKAKEIFSQYASFKEIPKNIFRSCPPDVVYIKGKLAGQEVKIIPFRSSAIPSRDVVYTSDEIDVIREFQFDSKAIRAINSVKHLFEGSYILTPFEQALDTIQKNGTKFYERNKFCRGFKKGFSENSEGGLQLPLEEQQRYSSRSA